MSARRMAGLTLVELMIAVALGLILTTGVINAFLTHKQGSYQDEQIASVQENARFALYALKRDLSMASYTAAVGMDTSGYGAAPATGCGAAWATALFSKEDVVNEDTGETEKVLTRKGLDFVNDAAAATDLFCADGDVLPGTDILVVRRGADDFVRRFGDSVNGRQANDEAFYLAEDGIYRGDAAAINAKDTVMEYIAKSYYVRDDYCLVLSALATTGGGMTRDCLVPGVEDLQIVWGIDVTDTDGDGDDDVLPDQMPNWYDDNPDATELSQSVAAQIHILVRSTGTVPGYKDSKTYMVGNVERGPFEDGYYRRVFSTSVRIPNNYLATPGLTPGGTE